MTTCPLISSYWFLVDTEVSKEYCMWSEVYLQKDSHSTEVGQTAGDHVSESRLLLADRRSRDAPVGAVSANHCITNRKSVPPSQREDDLRSKSCQKSITSMCPIFHIHCLDIGNLIGIKTHKCPLVCDGEKPFTLFSTSVIFCKHGFLILSVL